eukprot:gene17759-24123_t
MFASPARAMQFALLVVAALLLVSTPSHASVRKLKGRVANSTRAGEVHLVATPVAAVYGIACSKTKSNRTMTI